MTPGCTVQACGLRDAQLDLKNHGIVVLGLSPDKPAALKKFQEKDHLNFDLLSDLDHSVAAAYGSWGTKQFMGKVFDGILRQSYLLDKEGKVLHVITKVDTKTHAQDVLKFYQSL
jgi:peroxiredoxin Q/BCP